MSARPTVLDLFCGAGGAGVGYHRAGFDVTGVDIVPQPHYPFRFLQADALTFPLDGYDVIHASPPCQAYTSVSNRWRGHNGQADRQPRALEEMLCRLRGLCLPYVVENVVGARRHLRNALVLDGGMFGLAIHRPRLFESNVLLFLPARGGNGHGKKGIYGKLDGRWLNRRVDGSYGHAVASLDEASACMGISWMTWPELREAIPPAYTHWIGTQLMAAVQHTPVAARPQAEAAS